MSEQDFLSKLKENQHIIFKLVHIYAITNEDKKDLYQEIVLQAWKNYQSFRGDAKFSTWLYRLCLNTIFTIRRKTNRLEYTDTSRYEGRLVSKDVTDEKERLYKAMRTLPEVEKAIISMHLDGYHNAEISEFLGISANLVGVKLHRAKQQLTTVLKNI